MSLGGYPQFVAPLAPCNLPIRRCGVPEAAASRRILIMPRMAHGDILMMTPLLAALRAAYPDAHLTCAVEPPVRAALDASPHLDALLLWDGKFWKRMVRRGLYPFWLVQGLRFRGELRRRAYDLFIALDAENWPLLAWAMGAPQVIGVFDTFADTDRKKRIRAPARWYTTRYTRADLPSHRTDQYLLPLRALGLPTPDDKRMTIGYTDQDRRAVQVFLSGHGVSHGDRLVVLAPATTWQSRNWPEERYSRVADLLGQRHACKILLVGGHKDGPVLERVAAQMRTSPIQAAGEIADFRELAALLDRAALVVSGDTGPMHAAGAVDAPHISLFGPTPVQGRVPLGGRGLPLARTVPCGPCEKPMCPNTGDDYMRCLRQLTVKEVYEAARQMLSESPKAHLAGVLR